MVQDYAGEGSCGQDQDGHVGAPPMDPGCRISDSARGLLCHLQKQKEQRSEALH